MLASLAAVLVAQLGVVAPAFPAQIDPAQVEPGKAKKVELHDPATLKADFNAAAGAPRVVIILSPS